MKTCYATFLFAFLLCLLAMPQSALSKTNINAEPETPEPGWEYSLRTSLTGTQASYRNWSQGGINNVSALATTGFSARYKKDSFSYSLNVNLRYGQSRIGDGDFIKSDDLIRIRNQARRMFRDERFSAIFNLNFESQFDKGYKNPVPDEGESRILQSRFFSPAYLSQVLGLSYNPDRYFRAETGLAMKQTFVSDTSLSERYGLDAGDTFRNEAGFSVLLGYERRIMENIHFSGYVETFTNVNKAITSTDVLFVSEITGQINRYISTNVEFAMAYNDDITKELQVKQIISVGFSYTFFDN
ncbi:DUF3078 domain-containing protein [Balneolaceae bacterium ANBcel3]|nr:DUF3078 domain-containing protein [Balneolaceae bacterium ANBcel3]